jgi:hypothetical protein
METGQDLTLDDGRDRDTPLGVDELDTPPPAKAQHDDDDDVALLPRDEGAGYQYRWQELQTGFVDEPRRTVEQADELVAQVMQRLADSFASERERLEGQWSRGEDVSTEDLRVALQRYRAFFRRLLSA